MGSIDLLLDRRAHAQNLSLAICSFPTVDYRADLNVKAGSILTLSVYELGANLLRRVKRLRIGYAVIHVMDVAELGGY